MSIPQLVKFIQKFVKSFQTLIKAPWRPLRKAANAVTNLLLRLFVKLTRRPSSLSNSGFVLPTVTMVILVVVLLTTAIVIRSFDRAKNISNYRVNQEVLNSALPALDRAKAKIEALFEDPTLPSGTPSDIAINDVLTKSKYTLGDELRLQVAYDIDGNNSIQTSGNLEQQEAMTTAWRFPVDSDNNGLYDSFTLYSIHFRNPPLASGGAYSRERTPLEARSLPMANITLNKDCPGGSGTSASLIGTTGWAQVGGKLKKSFFVHVATVPITDKSASNLIPTADLAKYENFTSSRGFSALEYQQDQAKIPLANNAVLFEDDLDIRAGASFTLNGRVFTNSNLFVSEGSDITFRLVSSPNSCYYEEANSKILVGGNVNYGQANLARTDTNKAEVHLYNGLGTAPITGEANASLSKDNKSVNETSPNTAYNTYAYERRLNKLVELALGTTNQHVYSSDPSEVQSRIQDRLSKLTSPSNDRIIEIRKEELYLYFKKRTRRVPFKEVAYGTNEDLSTIALQGSGNTLRAPDSWMYPFDPADGKTVSATTYARLALSTDGNKLKPAATEFDAQKELGKEQYVGDRVLIGNNLPELWYKDGEWVNQQTQQTITGTEWDAPTGATPRTRKSRTTELADFGSIQRDGFWETQAAEQPKNPLDGVGGLRVVTGAGIYLNTAKSSSGSTVVWPDWMPVLGSSTPNDLTGQQRPYLQMRASAVYHYRYENGKKPIACVNNYYDPTSALVDNANNGKTYSPPSSFAVTGTVQTYLNYQASLRYPNGRLVNPTLKQALDTVTAGKTPTLAQQSAIDSSICGLHLAGITGITALTASTTPTSGYTLPDNTIKETAFLDGRQIKSVDKDYNPATGKSSLTGKYDLAVEQRQPLEIRATVLDLDKLRKAKANTSNTTDPEEYMLPNSGIIYATRNDALPDLSDATNNEKLSATDFKLDPTRRPNAIMLVNGQKLGRSSDGTNTNGFREVEKGLILVSNLPVYIKGEFNPHKDASGNVQEEFTDTSSTFYNRATLNTNFACRSGDPRLASGSCSTPDEWRAATVLSDAVTLLSNSFREGFRNEGGYDLRNHEIDNIADPDGNGTNDIRTASVIAQARQKQGFWNNDFAVNGLSSGRKFYISDTDGDGDIDTSDTSTTYTDAQYSDPSNNAGAINSSYFNNFVTPVQRRVSFPEYIMEICRKIPVSECRDARDWYVGYDSNGDGVFSATEKSIYAKDIPISGFDKTRLIAGTTALPPLDSSEQRFPRRIAFQRGEHFELVFTVPDESTGRAAAKPYGVDCDSDNNSGNGVDHICVYPGPNAIVSTATLKVTHPSPAANNLWYRATTNTSGDPGSSASISYRNDRPLYYLPPELGGSRLILPETQCFTATGIVDCESTADPAPSTVFNLNLPRNNTTYPAGSSYTVCMKAPSTNPNTGATNRYKSTGGQLNNNTQCPGASTTGTWKAIEDANTALSSMATSTNPPRPINTAGTVVSSYSGGTLRANPSNAAGGRVNFVDVSDFAAGTTVRLEANGVSSPVFVFYKNNALKVGAGVTIELNGVSPNDIFWAVGNISFDDATAALPTKFAGTFINSGTATPSVGTNVQVNGGRFLGFNVAPSIGTGASVTAVTADGQPGLVPVLNLQYMTSSPGNSVTTANANSSSTVDQTRWMAKASGNTIFNVLMGTGDTPSRPATQATVDDSDNNGGLANLPRFLENWKDTKVAIQGSLIQIKRSSYATAPIRPLLEPVTVTTNGANWSPTWSNVSSTSNTAGKGGLFGYVQGYGYTNEYLFDSTRLPFYYAPNRDWGFDVGLLSQIPDLFMQRFTVPPTDPPNEYFREGSRDDQWIQTLLCAKAPNSTGQYTVKAINNDQRPSTYCTNKTGG